MNNKDVTHSKEHHDFLLYLIHVTDLLFSKDKRSQKFARKRIDFLENSIPPQLEDCEFVGKMISDLKSFAYRQSLGDEP